MLTSGPGLGQLFFSHRLFSNSHVSFLFSTQGLSRCTRIQVVGRERVCSCLHLGSSRAALLHLTGKVRSRAPGVNLCSWWAEGEDSWRLCVYVFTFFLLESAVGDSLPRRGLKSGRFHFFFFLGETIIFLLLYSFIYEWKRNFQCHFALIFTCYFSSYE